MADLPVPKHFKFCPSCGAADLGNAEGKDNAVHCRPCGFTLFFNPTCSAGALIFDQSGRLLVVVRAREPAKGKYGIPGGFADFGERLEEVVAREVKEEINLDLTGYRFFASFPNQYHYKSVVYPVIDTYFTATIENHDGLAPEESEVSEIRLVDPAAVPNEQWAFPSLRNAIAQYLSAKSSR